MTGQTSKQPSTSIDADEPEQPNLTFWQMLSSVMAAAFGVQSSKNRQRDFSRGKPIHFIIIGLGFTVVFVLVMVSLVQFILS
jgi:hypothetical protein